MRICFGVENFFAKSRNPVVAVGNFDGIHRGHRKIFNLLSKYKKVLQGTAVIYTFHPHPTRILRPKKPSLLLHSLDQKLTLLKNLGVDVVVVEPFDKPYSHMTAREFFENVILRSLRARVVLVGYDFGFGAHREGTPDLLKKWCREVGIQAFIIPPVKIGTQIAGSSKIRSFILEGNVEKAHLWLQHPFFLEGLIIHGKKRGGHTLNIPTANLATSAELVPARGVYLAFIEWQGILYPGITNVGYRPTFDKLDKISIETYLIHFTGRLYGERIFLHFLRKLRPERAFPSGTALQRQILKDLKKAKKFFGLTP